MGVGLAVGAALACGPLPLCFRACNYQLPWSVGPRNSMCGQGCGQGARPASTRSHGHCPVGLMADIPGTFPSPGAATGPHRVGVGSQSLQAGQTSQPPRLGCLATNFLLGSLRPKGLQVLPSASIAIITARPHGSLSPGPAEIPSAHSAGGVLYNHGSAHITPSLSRIPSVLRITGSSLGQTHRAPGLP